MGLKYTSIPVTGFNSTPPPDDGTEDVSNQVQWSKHINKIGAPLKTAVDSINLALLDALDQTATSITTSYNTVADDHLTTIEIASTATSGVIVYLGTAATLAAGYVVTVSNQSSYVQTISRVTSANGINGSAANISIYSKESICFAVNANVNGYNIVSRSRRNDVLSVKDFGAVGDGVTDDTAAIQAAIASGAKTIYGVQGDTYLLGAAGLQFASLTGVRFVANGATLKFNAAATQTMGGFGSTMIKFDTCTNCGIEGWTIDGNNKATNAIGFTGCTESYADRNRITASGLNAQIVSVSNTRNRYAYNTVYSSIGAARGMWLGNTNAGEQETDPLITGNVVRSNAGSGISGTRYGGRILGNVCLSNGGAGIVEGGEHATGIIGNGVVISGNTCNSNTFHGIQLGDIAGWLTSADSTYNLTVQGNHCALNTQSGIYVVNVRDSSVAGNVCVDNGGNGITASPAIRVALSANICYDSRSGGSRTQDFGILIIAQSAAGECATISLVGNICYNHTTYGIYAVTTAPGTIVGLVLSGNTAFANSGIGIALINDAADSILGSVVCGNSATGNTTADLRIDPLDVVLSGNKYATMSGANPTGAFTFTDADTTPSVKGREYFKCTNTGATVITMFDDGVAGQKIVVWFTNANTTVTDGGNILLAGAANFVSSSDDTLSLIFDGTAWHETARSVN